MVHTGETRDSAVSVVCIGSEVDRGGPCPGETRDSTVYVAKPRVVFHSGIGRALMARDIRQLLAWKTKRNKKQAFVIREKHSSPNLLRYILAYADFTPE